MINFLVDCGIKMFVIVCNIVIVVVLYDICEKLDIFVIGVI